MSTNWWTTRCWNPLGCAALFLVLAGCAAPIHRQAVPQDLLDEVRVQGMPADIRDWGDRPSPVLRKSVAGAYAAAHGTDAPADVLAISGGGSNGAYAAGLLCGWTASGNRPVFRVVTGVSVGALVAPLAFLGPAYDDRLVEMTRAARDETIYRKKGLLVALSSDSLADNSPLIKYVARFFDEPLLRAVAAEHAKGRRLFVATTNLDAKRPVIWDMGAIASSGSPRALAVFRDVIVASTAVPVAFPPTYVRVEHDGRRYDEMHVDGGVTEQIILYGSWIGVGDLPPRRDAPAPTYYVIRNGKLTADWRAVEPTIPSIATHALGRLIQAQAVGDLWQAYVTCGRDGLLFRLASIPEEAVIPGDAGFDPRTIAFLFERGYAQARAGYPWADRPPGVSEATSRPPMLGTPAAPPDD
jgi:hypothetical protein